MDESLSDPGTPGSWWIAYGNWLFRYRNAAFPAVMLLLLAAFRPPPPQWTIAAGLLAALLGQGIRAAVIGLAYIKRGGLNKRIHADVLVTDGLFAHARNPLYVGNLLILAGLFLLHGNLRVLILGCIFFGAAYAAIVAAEERFLLGRFGNEYRDYCGRVNRWIPDPRGLAGTLGRMQFNWRRVVLKDYASAFTWMVTAVALLGYREWLYGGLGRARGAALLAAGFTLFLGLASARYVKKRGILRE